LWRFCIRRTSLPLNYDTVSEFGALGIAIKLLSSFNSLVRAVGALLLGKRCLPPSDTPFDYITGLVSTDHGGKRPRLDFPLHGL
jgi:hypothetical protein